MNVKIISYFIISIIFIPILSAIAQKSLKKFEPLSGTVYIHEFSDRVDSLSAQKIFEYRADNGLPLWFSRDIKKVVCLDETCRMVQLRLFWDGAANYLKFEIPENFPLSKTDHTVFSEDDYKKLDMILSEANSILANQKKEDLVESETKSYDGIDAVTAATRPAYRDYLVSNAAYTCYTLWHTVYGPTQDKINQIIESKADKLYLQKIFELQEPDYLTWAIQYIDRSPEHQTDFHKSILDLLASDNTKVSGQALAYFTNKRISNPEIQKDLSLNFWKYPRNFQNELINKYSGLEYINNEAYLILLEQYENNLITAGDLRKIITSVHPENIRNEKVQNKLKTLSQGLNPFVRNLTMKLIEDK
jgi:hypothetical protein